VTNFKFVIATPGENFRVFRSLEDWLRTVFV
jgi:hypothetical protein